MTDSHALIRAVTTITITNPGGGYTSAPLYFFTNTGTGATTSAVAGAVTLGQAQGTANIAGGVVTSAEATPKKRGIARQTPRVSVMREAAVGSARAQTFHRLE